MINDIFDYIKNNRKRVTFRNTLSFIGLILFASALIWLIVTSISDGIKENKEPVEDTDTEEVTKLDEPDCNTQGIIVHGFLDTYDSGSDMFDESVITTSEDTEYYINQANFDPDIKAIMIEIDSGGGAPVAGEEIAEAISRAHKPTVALIRQTGASAAYWAASAADYIFASKNSDIGSIGVTMSYIDNTIQNQRDGLSYVQLSSGRFKDMGDPDKVMTYEEKNLLMRDLKIIHNNFIEAVAKNRGLQIEEVQKIADGSSVLGERALELGLIDEIGGIYDVKEYLKEKIGEDVRLCW